MGEVEGKVVWHKKRSFGDDRIGIRFTKSTKTLESYLYKKYCELSYL
jgi:hypothetical protein